MSLWIEAKRSIILRGRWIENAAVAAADSPPTRWQIRRRSRNSSARSADREMQATGERGLGFDDPSVRRDAMRGIASVNYQL